VTRIQWSRSNLATLLPLFANLFGRGGGLNEINVAITYDSEISLRLTNVFSELCLLKR